MLKLIRETRTLTLSNNIFTAIVTIKNDRLLSIKILRKCLVGNGIFLSSVESLDSLKSFLGDVHDVLEDNNLAGEIIETL